MQGRRGPGIRWTVLLIVAAVLAAGCTARSTHQASSVVDYLYANKTEPVVTPAVPHLALPLRVGVAFVPPAAAAGTAVPFPVLNAARLSEKERLDLMQQISAEFRAYPFVHAIEIIPSAYLRPKGGFDNLDQLRTMFGLDVIALISYDQVQHTDEGLLSMSYWTLVGAYVVRGEKNDTSTMLDAAVYDIPSRSLLFRAPGISHVQGAATPVNLTEQLRLDAREGFRLAAVDLVGNLRTQLELFQEKVRQSPQQYRIEHRPGYVGGGSLDGALAAAAAVLGAVWVGTGRRRR